MCVCVGVESRQLQLVEILLHGNDGPQNLAALTDSPVVLGGMYEKMLSIISSRKRIRVSSLS